ncbi:IS607 family transposase [Limosilactobacillus reuteri]|uniref:IS607 family transposase n=2 Tax=Limosilactobacillus reuteri TaxID=1598 RepID=A0A855XDM5_LIMRT|nr:IS607 family transposase [Limosilactobacillus reuteri]PWT34473.1 IS607 family transposase [Limosilactobacillus reuteri]PWT39573.1 IS607 family transposase [Limosilactobacillus reuteri]PWT55805.1 IS607 family transposase [Limosilactobacillus reuteri]PWT57260.1 IS607 family transposase [Limosilactobacillus reuteri]PWT58068.1 IS607 family transposase [Limosilactobacillus reuteri]
MSILKPKDMSQKIGVSVRTLQKWDKAGILKAYRTPTNRRYYTEEQYLQYIGKQGDNQSDRKVVAYARVSTYNQKDDLKNQLAFIRQFANANGIIIDEAISDIGSGLNYNRKKWNLLLDQVMQNQISIIYITYKDRFIRFGYEWFERLCNRHGTKIVVLNNPDTSPDKEMVEDLVSIIHVFSCRLYGLRKYKKKLQDDSSLKGGEKNDSHTKGSPLSQFNDEKSS